MANNKKEIEFAALNDHAPRVSVILYPDYLQIYNIGRDWVKYSDIFNDTRNLTCNATVWDPDVFQKKIPTIFNVSIKSTGRGFC